MSAPAPRNTPDPGAGVDWRVFISSCDAYSDLWPVLFHFLFQYWPEVPQPVYLVSNYHTYADARVETIRVGPDRHWSDNTRTALERVAAPYLLYLQDDYLLNAPVNDPQLRAVLGQVQSRAGAYLSLLHQADQGVPVAGTPLRRMPRDYWRADLQAGFWRKDTLAGVLAPGHNPWEGERSIKALKDQSPPGFFLLEAQAPRLLPYVEAVKGAFWKADALEFCRQRNVAPDLGARPCPPAGEDFLSKALRSLHKRRLRLRGTAAAALAARRGGRSIAPLRGD